MTREEAKEILKKLIPQPQRGNGKLTIHLLVTEALNMAIKALEQEAVEENTITESIGNSDKLETPKKNLEVAAQEPCEDCISRKEYIKRYRAWHYSEYGCKPSYDTIAIMLANSMPSVKQEPKQGHWIDGHCSECGCDVPAYIIDWKWQKDMNAKYCPNCGCRMDSEAEQ